jgi:hypothetical protein
MQANKLIRNSKQLAHYTGEFSGKDKVTKVNYTESTIVRIGLHISMCHENSCHMV